MNITCIIFGVLFVTIGFIFYIGKAHKHMESYNMMSETEKASIKIVSLCRNVGTAIGLAGVGFLLAGLIQSFAERIFIWYMIAWFIGTGLDIRFISKSNHYKNNV